MPMPRKALGKGLEALIPSSVATSTMDPAPPATASVRDVPIEDIGPNPYQPRTRFDDESIQELASSIKATGVLQPVLVRREKDGYQLVVGERRLRAARLAGLENIPAIVR